MFGVKTHSFTNHMHVSLFFWFLLIQSTNCIQFVFILLGPNRIPMARDYYFAIWQLHIENFYALNCSSMMIYFVFHQRTRNPILTVFRPLAYFIVKLLEILLADY